MMNNVGVSLFERRRPSKLNTVINVILVLLVIILAVEIAFNSRYTSIYVDGRSMLPTLIGADDGVNGDYVFVNTKISPGYGDIVVVEPQNRTDYNIIKRVVAFGGDTVKIEEGILYIMYAGSEEFEAVKEDYIFHEYNDGNKRVNNYPEHTVAEGKMFLLGDNRNESADSRINGDYSLDDLVGVVPQWSLDKKSEITAIFTFIKRKLPQALGFRV